jgi:hypothetical protein
MQFAVCIGKRNAQVLIKKCTTRQFTYASLNFKMKLHIYNQWVLELKKFKYAS